MNEYIISAAKGYWRMGATAIEIAGILNLPLYKVEQLIMRFEFQSGLLLLI